MAAISNAPAAYDALVALFSRVLPSTVAIVSGEIGQNIENELLVVTKIDLKQSSASIGNLRREEELLFPCAIHAFTGDENLSGQLHRAFALLALVEAELTNNDPTLAASVRFAELLVGDARWDHVPNGTECVLQFEIRAQAPITRP